MKFKPVSLALFSLILLLVSISLSAAPMSAFRCGSRLISPGNSTSQLIQTCGQPTSVSQREKRVPVETYDQETGKTITVMESRPYEIWTYNPGPSRLVTEVTVRNNVVESMESTGYGW